MKRQRGLGLGWVAGALALALGGCCNPPPATLLPVPLDGQHMDNWCWAASGAMVTSYFGHSVTQCRQVDDQNSLSNCCNLPTPGSCDLGGVTHIDNYGFNRTVVTTPILYKSLQCELSSDQRAMIWDKRWNGGGGHTQVLVGYETVGGSWLWVNNPEPVDQGTLTLISYDDYIGGAGYDYFYGRTEWGIVYVGGK